MNTAYAKEFLVFAQRLNYSEAARDLYISRSTLRDHIAELEFEVGVPLVLKTDDGLRLTVFGQRFIDSAQKLCDLANDIVSDFREFKENYLHVNISYSTLGWLRLPLLRARMNLVAARPGRVIELVTSGSPRVSRDALDSGAFDIAVFRVDEGVTPEKAPELFSGLTARKICTADILLFTGVENPIAQRDELKAADFTGQTLLVPPDLYSAHAKHVHEEHAPELHLETAAFSDFMEYYLCDYSHKIGTIPRPLVREYGMDQRIDCKLLEVEGLQFRSDFYVACKEEFLREPLATEYFDEVLRLLDE